MSDGGESPPVNDGPATSPGKGVKMKKLHEVVRQRAEQEREIETLRKDFLQARESLEKQIE